MKRSFVSLLLCMSLCIASLQVFAFTDVENDEDIDLVAGLGIMPGMEDGTFAPEGTITRGEMAQLISNIYEYDSEESEPVFDFFGNDVEVILEPGATESVQDRYIDVTQNHQYYNEIITASTYGVMIGTSENTFEPERNLRVKEALKVFVDFLGYRPTANLNGGYPSGYIITANSLGLKVTSGYNDDITRAELAHLFAQALEDVDIMMADFDGQSIKYSAVEGNNLMSKFLNVNKITGIVTENSITSFTGESTIGDNRIKIMTDDGEEYIYDFDEKTSYVEDFIGKRVDCYFKNNDSLDPGKIVYCRVNKKNSELTINIDSVENADDFNGTAIEYIDSTDRVKTAKILDGAYYIINGKAASTVPANIFDYDNGYITFISTQSSKTYDLVIFTVYENWVIKSIDVDEGYIYNKNADRSIETDDEYLLIDEDVNYIITDENGNNLDVGDLSKDSAIDVARSMDNLVVRIKVTNNKITDFVITSINAADNEISDGTNVYRVSRFFENSKMMQEYKAGNNYTLTLNSFGDVVWIEAGANTWRMGYAQSVRYIEEEDYVMAKILVADKTFKQYILADKVKFSDSDGSEPVRREAKAIASELDNLNAVIRYKLNNDEYITDIEMALDEDVENSSDDRLYILGISTKESDEYVYSTQFQTFGCKIFISDGNTQILSVPVEPTDYTKYVFTSTSSISNGQRYDFVAYGTDYRNPEAEFMTISADATTNLSDTTNPSIVLDIQTTLDSDDQIVTEITVSDIYGNVTTLHDIIDNDWVHNALAKTANQSNILPRDIYTVEKGDIIRYTTDGSGYLSYIEMIIDANGTYNNSMYADTLPDVDTSFSHTHTGVFAGTIGYYSETISNTNPLVTTTVGPTTSNPSKLYNSGAPRTFFGYVYDVYGDYVTFTTKDLYAGSDGMDEGRYTTETRGMSNIGPTAYVKYDGKNVTVRQGSISDIKSYLDYPNGFSRILVTTASTDRRSCIIIDGFMK